MWSLVHPSLTQCTCMEYDLQPLLSQSSPPPLLLKYTLFSRNTQVNVYVFLQCYSIHAILLYLKRYWAYEVGVHTTNDTKRQKETVEVCLYLYHIWNKLCFCMYLQEAWWHLGWILVILKFSENLKISEYACIYIWYTYT